MNFNFARSRTVSRPDGPVHIIASAWRGSRLLDPGCGSPTTTRVPTTRVPTLVPNVPCDAGKKVKPLIIHNSFHFFLVNLPLPTPTPPQPNPDSDIGPDDVFFLTCWWLPSRVRVVRFRWSRDARRVHRRLCFAAPRLRGARGGLNFPREMCCASEAGSLRAR